MIQETYITFIGPSLGLQYATGALRNNKRSDPKENENTNEEFKYKSKDKISWT